jgi:hypothetical protein
VELGFLELGVTYWQLGGLSSCSNYGEAFHGLAMRTLSACHAEVLRPGGGEVDGRFVGSLLKAAVAPISGELVVKEVCFGHKGKGSELAAWTPVEKPSLGGSR